MSGGKFTKMFREGPFPSFGKTRTGMVVGLFAMLVAAGGLYWNEARTATRARSVEAPSSELIEISGDYIDPANEGRLVHFTGSAMAAKALTDNRYSISQNALQLRRSVEMFQWRENVVGGSSDGAQGDGANPKAYSYETVWSSELIDSGQFMQPGQDNPRSMPVEDFTKSARDCTMGAFKLPSNLLDHLSDYETVTPPPDGIRDRDVLTDGMLYISGRRGQKPDPASPEVGDIRITWSVVRPGPVSVIGMQQGKTVAPWTGLSDSNLFLIDTGARSGHSMLARLARQDPVVIWGVRVVGMIMLLLGTGLLLTPAGAASKSFAPLERMIKAGPGTTMLGAVLVVSLLVFGLGWIVDQTMMGVVFVVLALATAAGLHFRARGGKKRKRSASSGSKSGGAKKKATRKKSSGRKAA